MKCQRKDCIYRRPISSNTTEKVCNYLLDTGRLRNSSPEGLSRSLTVGRLFPRGLGTRECLRRGCSDTLRNNKNVIRLIDCAIWT